MATFSDDFSTRSGTATVSAPTAITGWTFTAPGGSAAYISASIVTDGGALGGKVLRLADAGWGNGPIVASPTSIGSVGAGTATEVLASFRLSDVTSNVAGHFQAVVAMLRSLLDNSAYNGVGFQHNTTSEFQSWYFQGANDWANIGAAKDVSATLAAPESE
jgi:hypothetical protein